jgi:hypothetical protein
MKQFVVTGWGDTPLNYSQSRLDMTAKLKKAGKDAISALSIDDNVDVEFKTMAGWITYNVKRVA